MVSLLFFLCLVVQVVSSAVVCGSVWSNSVVLVWSLFRSCQMLPDVYPLKTVRVQCRRRIGVKENQWRRWSLQIQSLLTNRDGTILDGVHLWKRNVDREFKGVEECSICYSVLHIVDHSLPKVKCSVCHNAFHSGCLYKWFSNANKSTCPLCRSEF